MRRSEFKTLVTIGIIGAIVAASIYGGYIDFTPSTVSTGDDDDDDNNVTILVEDSYDISEVTTNTTEDALNLAKATADYIVFPSDGYACAKNGDTSRIDHRYTDINDTLNAVVGEGKTIYITGTYALDTEDVGSVTDYSIYLEMDDCTIAGNAVFDCSATNDDSWAYIRIIGEHNNVIGLNFNLDFATGVAAKRIIMITGDDCTIQGCSFIGQGKGTGIDTRQYSDIHYGYKFLDNYFENVSGIALHSASGALIKDNTIIDSPGFAIQIYSQCENCRVSHNYMENRIASIVEDSEGIFLGHGTTLPGTVKNNTVSENTIINFGRSYCHSNTTGNIWLNNIIKHDLGTALAGIMTSDDSENSFIGNRITSIAASGFTSIVISEAESAVVTGNKVSCNDDKAQISIVLRPLGTAVIKDNEIQANRGIFISYGDGVQITSNIINAGSSSLYGILLGYSNLKSSNVTIEGNIVTGFATASIRAPATYSAYITVTHNHVDSTIQNLGSNAITKYNVGYVTEASGSVTISNNTAYVTVTHGLATTPTMVIATGSSSDTNGCYVTNAGTTTFRINVATTLTSGDRTVYWYAEV